MLQSKEEREVMMAENNNERYRIIVMGAGAVGGYFGGRLHSDSHSEVIFIARGKHLQALQTEGLNIRSISDDYKSSVRAFDNLENYSGFADLILFTVKSYDTDEAIDKIRPVVGQDTQILTIQNGIENYFKLSKVFGEEHVIRGFCRIGAMVAEPGVITHSSMGSITIGENNGRKSGRLNELCSHFDKVNVHCTISENIEKEVWVKFAWNSVFNMITGLMGVTLDKIFMYPESEKLCRSLFNEISLLAGKYGIVFNEQDTHEIIDKSRVLGAFKTSTYQDRIRGKKLEYETFTGTIVRMAHEKNISLPYNESLYGLFKLMD
jgi:2-dehydropantoate 2-reductase